MSQFDRQMMNQLLSSQPLPRETIRQLFGQFVRGEFDEIQAASIVAAMKARGEQAEELVGAAEGLLEAAVPFPGAPVNAIDIVGTGGDGLNTLNISTLAALTTAAIGVPVAKHGNRSITSLSGSFDLLQRLGLNLNASPEKASELLKRVGICFLFAPNYHGGLRHVGDLRRRINARTIFNLLGPLVNPARPRATLLGVASNDLITTMSQSLIKLNCQSAAVVHGGGLDEVAPHAETRVVMIESGEMRETTLSPEDFGFQRYRLDELTCDSVEETHRRAERILMGEGSDAENAAVAMNAGLAASVFHGQGELPDWSERALAALRAGEVQRLVQRYRELDQQ